MTAKTVEAKAEATRAKAQRLEDARWGTCSGCQLSRRLDDGLIRQLRRYVAYEISALGDVPGHMVACPGSLTEPADASASDLISVE